MERGHFFCLFLFLFALLNLNSQTITATSGTVHACGTSPIAYQAPVGATTSNWTFGPLPPSTLHSGNMNVLNPTSFTATYNGIVNGSSVSFTVPVFVHAPPVAHFNLTQPSNPCVVKTITLTDQSTFSSPLVTWLWTYGDGGLGSSSGTHSYGYTFAGNYSVTLKVTDTYGCHDQKTIGTVIVTPSVQAVIGSNPSSLISCTNNLQATFSATNSIGTNLSYNWNFGNSQTSQLATAGPITFGSQSSPYIVTLTVSAGGCISTASTMVVVSPPTLSATLTPTVCVNQQFTVQVQSNNATTSWNFGNGTSTVLPTPSGLPPEATVHPVYLTPGVKTVLISAGTFPCIITLTKTLLVEHVVAHYTATPVITCQKSVAVTFSNQSTPNAVSFYWTYWDWQNTLFTSFVANPTLTFSMHSNNPYTLYPNYNTSPILLVTTAAGCVATSTIPFLPYVTLQVPNADYVKDKSSGCAPLAVTFTNTSVAPGSFPITSYTWCNGATPPVFVSGTGTPPPQTFTYTSTGVYYPYLIINTAGGCSAISYSDPVTVTSPPIISFNISPTLACVNQPIQIINTSPSLSAVQNWHVESDDGYFSSCINNPNPSWLFTHTGVHTFTLKGSINGCTAAAVSAQSVTIKGPLVKTRFETSCINRKVVVFHSELYDAQSASLNFGDGSPPHIISGNATGSVTNIVTHTYAATGNYTAVISGINALTGCGTNTFATSLQLRDIHASFISPTVICVNTPTTFFATGCVDVFTLNCSGRDKNYVWYFDNEPPSDSLNGYEYHTFTTVGIHTISLQVKDVNSCMDVMTKTISVSGPVLSFTYNANPICLSDGTVQITNTSIHLPDPITNYHWDFGDGQFFSTTTQTVPLHTYTSASSPHSIYNVVLTATNSAGCVTSKSQTFQVNKPDASFTLSQKNICLNGNNPATVNFSVLASFTTYTYNFNAALNATFVTTNSVMSYPYAAGVYTVSVRVKENSLGCENTQTQVINAAITPTASFYITSAFSNGNNYLCAPATMEFRDLTTPVNTNYNYTWKVDGFGQLQDSSVIFLPSHIFAGVNTATMTVSTGAPNFCQSTTTRNYTVYIAKASIVLSNTTVCYGDQVKFAIDTANGGGVKSWIWDYGDGSPSGIVAANSSPPTFTMHPYSFLPATPGNTVPVSLIYYSANNACKYFDKKIIKVVKVNAAMIRNNEVSTTDTIHCFRIEDTFKNVNFPANPTTLLYNWEFPGGYTFSDTVARYTFQSPGVHQVSLTVRDASSNCTAKAVRTMTILPLPTASISSGEFCANKPFPITTTLSPAVISGTFSPAELIVGQPVFNTTINTYSATAIMSVSSIFSINVTDTNNCVSETIDTMINVVPPPPHVRWDTTVIVGQPIPINGNVGNFTYTWSPVTTALSCTNCTNPVSTSPASITYSVNVEDMLRCSMVTNIYSVIIESKTTVDVPSAFTPNGDGTNDIIYVDGWGIKKLNFFRIYNRWGELLFESNDISLGWNGFYKGVPQNMETYVYQVSVQTWVEGKHLEKTSTFKLLR